MPQPVTQAQLPSAPNHAVLTPALPAPEFSTPVFSTPYTTPFSTPVFSTPMASPMASQMASKMEQLVAQPLAQGFMLQPVPQPFPQPVAEPGAEPVAEPVAKPEKVRTKKKPEIFTSNISFRLQLISCVDEKSKSARNFLTKKKKKVKIYFCFVFNNFKIVLDKSSDEDSFQPVQGLVQQLRKSIISEFY